MVEDPTPGEIIGRNVRAVREGQLLSRPDLAARSGVAKPTIAALELGMSAHPRRRTVEKIAGALGVPVEDLIREDLTRPKSEAPPSLEPTLFNGLKEERRAAEIPGWARAGLEKGAFVERFERAKESEEAAYQLHRDEMGNLERAEARPGTLRARNVAIAKARATAAAFLWTESLRGREVSVLDPLEIFASVIEAQRELLDELGQQDETASDTSEAS
jgi:transcriptional regulator with XRE-family HTH domain